MTQFEHINAAAIATYRAVGFVVEGVARESTLGSEGRWDGVLPEVGLLAEWPDAAAAPTRASARCAHSTSSMRCA